MRLSAAEIAALDRVTPGRRTCTYCFTDECQACAATLERLGCPLCMAPGQPSVFPVWGRCNRQGTACVACASLPQHAAAVYAACGDSSRGEYLETMVPKACGIG